MMLMKMLDWTLIVVGTTPFLTLVVSGTITTEAAGTASKRHSLHFLCLRVCISCCIGSSDFEELTPIIFINNNDSPSTDIYLFTVNDEATLEYEDRVLLRFTPAQANLIPELANHFEYIRDTAVVNIIDDDRKCLFPIYLFANGESVPFSFVDQFQRI